MHLAKTGVVLIASERTQNWLHFIRPSIEPASVLMVSTGTLHTKYLSRSSLVGRLVY
jgi:1,4-dihydroxy-2-naphthoate octaprenyltransferase